jgi:ribosome-associated protein
MTDPATDPTHRLTPADPLEDPDHVTEPEPLSEPEPLTEPQPLAEAPTEAEAEAVTEAPAGPLTDAEPGTAEAPSPDGLPHREAVAPRTDYAPLDLARRIVELAEDKKAADIVLLEIGELTTLADAFVICSGGSERQISAIADGIAAALRDEGVKPIGREGTSQSHWVLLDFGSVIVHVFTPPERDYYGLEKHWSAARVVIRVQ